MTSFLVCFSLFFLRYNFFTLIWGMYIYYNSTNTINRKFLQLHYFVNMGCLQKYLCLKMQLYLKQFYVIVYLIWYNVICWSSHIYKNSLFFSYHSLIFSITQGRWWIWQSVTQMKGMKNVIIQVTYFLNVPVVNLLFYCHIHIMRGVFLGEI